MGRIRGIKFLDPKIVVLIIYAYTWNFKICDLSVKNKRSLYFVPRKEVLMPIVNITLLPGRTPEKKEELIKNVTNSIADTLQIPKERVHIVLYEVSKENIGSGGIPLSKKDQ